MPTNVCCRTCHHCGWAESSSEGWCRMRQISVHSEIAVFALCHHWTKRAPTLPSFEGKREEDATDLQLDLGRSLVGTVGGEL